MNVAALSAEDDPGADALSSRAGTGSLVAHQRVCVQSRATGSPVSFEFRQALAASLTTTCFVWFPGATLHATQSKAPKIRKLRPNAAADPREGGLVIDGALRVGVGDARLDGMADVNLVCDVIPTCTRGQLFDQALGVVAAGNIESLVSFSEC